VRRHETVMRSSRSRSRRTASAFRIRWAPSSLPNAPARHCAKPNRGMCREEITHTGIRAAEGEVGGLNRELANSADSTQQCDDDAAVFWARRSCRARGSMRRPRPAAARGRSVDGGGRDRLSITHSATVSSRASVSPMSGHHDEPPVVLPQPWGDDRRENPAWRRPRRRNRPRGHAKRRSSAARATRSRGPR